ncbi:MAG: hypothetical protein RLZZ258_14, partial [Actinomycetota bacterium]
MARGILENMSNAEAKNGIQLQPT